MSTIKSHNDFQKNSEREKEVNHSNDLFRVNIRINFVLIEFFFFWAGGLD